jgi:outer membrane protein TolC
MIKRVFITGFLALLSVAAAGQQDSLSRYLAAAAENNPGVKAAFLVYKAALEKVPQAGAYQDPQLDMGFFLQPMELIDGRQIAEIRLMQMFPWFGTRKAARTEAQRMAQMSFEQFRETRDRLFLDVYTQWFVLCRLHQQLANMRANLAWLHRLEELALARFSSPTGAIASSPAAAPSPIPTAQSGGMAMGNMGGSQEATVGQPSAMGMSQQSGMSAMGASSGLAAVLQIQLEIAETENNIAAASSDIEAGKALFNALLNRRPDAEVIVPDTIIQIPFFLDETPAAGDILRNNPMLTMLDEEEKAYSSKAEMDRKMSLPMFGIGLQYMLLSKRASTEPAMEMGETAAASSMNGKDMIMPMVTITIPIFREKYRAQQRETSFLRQANRNRYDNTLNLLSAEMYRLKNELANAAGKIALYRRQAELSRSAANLAMQELMAGKGDLAAVIRIQRQLLEYELRTAEAVATYNTSVAGVQKLVAQEE